MCGRAYSTYTDDEISFQYLNRRQLKFGPLKPNYDMSPTQIAPTVRLMDGARDIDTTTWGLIPEWSPEFKMKFSTINARSEGVFESRPYKKPILQRRCIIPVSGFFEWKKGGQLEASVQDLPEGSADHVVGWHLDELARWDSRGTTLVLHYDDRGQFVYGEDP
jgi:putative SOS response-associated peptidase YedK